jgi:hypothetical protein
MERGFSWFACPSEVSATPNPSRDLFQVEYCSCSRNFGPYPIQRLKLSVRKQAVQRPHWVPASRVSEGFFLFLVLFAAFLLEHFAVSTPRSCNLCLLLLLLLFHSLNIRSPFWDLSIKKFLSQDIRIRTLQIHWKYSSSTLRKFSNFQKYSIPGSSWYRSFKKDPILESGWYESSIKYPKFQGPG